MKVRALVLASQGKLRDCGIENPARDARLMLANCLDVEVHKLNFLDNSFPLKAFHLFHQFSLHQYKIFPYGVL